MSPTDKPAFVAMLMRAFRMAGKDIAGEPDTIADWLDEFAAYPVEALDAAFRRHRRESVYPPKPADIYRYLDGDHADDGRPGPDEAWGLLLRVIRDERETGVMTEEMREGWGICQPILDEGDEIGARRCFLEAYGKRVSAARERREPAHWTATLGTDVWLRQLRLEQAVESKRLAYDHAIKLLPGPSSISIDQVAGLLEAPDSPRKDFDIAHRLHELAAMLRAVSVDDEGRRAEERRARMELETARRAELLGQIPVAKSETSP